MTIHLLFCICWKLFTVLIKINICIELLSFLRIYSLNWYWSLTHEGQFAHHGSTVPLNLWKQLYNLFCLSSNYFLKSDKITIVIQQMDKDNLHSKLTMCSLTDIACQGWWGPVYLEHENRYISVFALFGQSSFISL